MQLLIEQLVNGRITLPARSPRALSCRFMCRRRTSAEYLHFANKKFGPEVLWGREHHPAQDLPDKGASYAQKLVTA